MPWWGPVLIGWLVTSMLVIPLWLIWRSTQKPDDYDPYE